MDQSSVMNTLLEDEIGGNSITSFLFTINSNDDMNENLQLLNTIDLMRQILNFPVRNDENFCSLKRQVRKALKEEHRKQLDTALANTHPKGPGSHYPNKKFMGTLFRIFTS